MPGFLRKGSPVLLFCILFFFFASVHAFSQTLYFVYSDPAETEEGSTLSYDKRKEEIRELILLDLPFLLGTNRFREVSADAPKREALEKAMLSRVKRADSDGDNGTGTENDGRGETGTGTAEAAELPSEAEGENTEELSDGGSLTEPDRNTTPCDPLFALIGIGDASAKDAFVYIRIKKAEIGTLPDERYFGETVFDFFMAFDNRTEIFHSEIHAVGLAAAEEEAMREIALSLRISLKSVLNALFGKAGSPYIVNFINNKKVVIAHGRRQGAFPGAFYRILRHEIGEDGEVGERIIGRLYVEKCEEDYSFCRILYAREQPVPGDGISKIPGSGVHQSLGYDLLISSLPVTETESDIYVNHLLGSRWVVNREMPVAKPAFGFEILTGTSARLDTVGMMKSPVIGNIFAGMQVDRFFHRFSFSPFVDLGFAFTSNVAENKKPLMWFTCKAGARFLWMVHEQVGVYLEGGYISWLGIPGKEAVYEDSQYIYYAPNDYTGGFGGVGVTVMY